MVQRSASSEITTVATRKPRRKTLPKTVEGKNVTQNAFKRAIVRAIHAHGPAKPRHVTLALGEEWKPNARIVAQTMANMVNSKELVKNEDGFYLVAVDWEIKQSRKLENVLIEVVRSLGGVCRTRDILDAFGVRVKGFQKIHGMRAQEHPDYKKIHRYLVKSEVLRRWYVRGVWGLPRDELMAATVPGFWAEFLLVHGFYDWTPPRQHARRRGHLPYVLAKKLFRNVGEAFMEVRDTLELSFEQIIEDPGINAALNIIAGRLPSNCVIYDEIKGEAIRHAGPGADEATVKQVHFRELKKLPIYILAHFEEGKDYVHRLAPVELYTAFAAKFELMAPALSRGILLCSKDPSANVPDDSHLTYEEWLEAAMDTSPLLDYPEPSDDDFRPTGGERHSVAELINAQRTRTD